MALTTARLLLLNKQQQSRVISSSLSFHQRSRRLLPPSSVVSTKIIRQQENPLSTLPLTTVGRLRVQPLRNVATDASLTSLWLQSPSLLQRQQQQRRHYLFLPSDWSELRYRWKLFWEKNTPTKVKLQWQDRRTHWKAIYQGERSRLQARYQRERARLKLRYQTEKSRLTSNYQFEKRRLQRRYRLQWNQFVRRYQEQYKPQASAYYRTQLTQWKSRYQEQYKPKASAYYQRGRTQLSQFQHRYQEQYKPQASAYYQRRRTEFRQASARLQQRRRDFTQRWSARRRDLFRDGRDMVRGAVTRMFTIEEPSHPHWFDPVDGRPLTSRDPTGRFVNPWMSWSTNGVHSISNLIKWRYQRGIRQWKERGLLSFLPKDLPQLLFGSAMASAADAAALKKSSETAFNLASGEVQPSESSSSTTVPRPDEIQFTWIGHSTCLVQMGNATILTDPIFSHRCTPFPRLPGVGVARDVPPSMSLDDLPDTIDACLISHDHYDHLDRLTITALQDKVNHWILPQRLPEWLETRCSIDPNRMTELEWWESVHLVQDQDEQNWQIREGGNILDNNNNTMTITCCPAQHWSSRTFFDRCKRLWCGFAVETKTHTTTNIDLSPVVQKFYFAGDSGMPRNEFPLFQQIGEFCGRGMYHHLPNSTSSSESTTPTTEQFHPFDLAAIPIGAYDPSFLMQDAHMDPSEAVQCAQQLQAKRSVAIHWGTFALSEEPLNEPPEKLQKVLDLPENQGTDFATLPVGGSLTVPSTHTGRRRRRVAVIYERDTATQERKAESDSEELETGRKVA